MSSAKLYHLFLPHPETHKKAHLLSWRFLILYIFGFILLQQFFSLINLYKPGVLGISTDLSIEKIIEDTNKERQKNGLSILKQNQSLNTAAAAKAANMLEENYWAHFSPSGKDPWGFITGAGYKFSFAGENLAKNFYTSETVVTAWMNSPSHKENMLNPNYQEIGIAVVEGKLEGQNTTLVVQMFGKPTQVLAAAPPKPAAATPAPKAEIEIEPVVEVEVPAELAQELEVAQRIPEVANQSLFIETPSIKPLIDPFVINKTLGLFFITFIGGLLLLDFVELKRRGVFRLSSHHFAHLSLLSVSAVSVASVKTGEILTGISITI